jgi:hypothetical protein
MTAHAIIGLIPRLLAQAPGGGEEAPPLQPLPHPEIPAPPALPDPIPLWIIIVCALLILALLALIVWLLFRARKNPAFPARQPLRVARRALDQLKHDAPNMTPAQIAHRVSEILRLYLFERYRLPAPFRTTPELFPATDSADSRSTHPVRQKFGPVAEKYDELSFAPAPATHAAAVSLVDTVINLLEDERA